jgi:hypothetical protein
MKRNCDLGQSALILQFQTVGYTHSLYIYYRTVWRNPWPFILICGVQINWNNERSMWCASSVQLGESVFAEKADEYMSERVRRVCIYIYLFISPAYIEAECVCVLYIMCRPLHCILHRYRACSLPARVHLIWSMVSRLKSALVGESAFSSCNLMDVSLWVIKSFETTEKLLPIISWALKDWTNKT